MEPTMVRQAGAKPSARHIEDNSARNALSAGTTVLTLEGALPVEFVNVGDRVITRDSGMAVVTGMRRTKSRVRAVSIKAGSLGNTRPDRDVTMPAGQELLIRDWRAQALFGAGQALVSAQRLVDGEFIRDLGEVEMDMVELIFDTPHILYADGLEVASAQKVEALADA